MEFSHHTVKQSRRRLPSRRDWLMLAIGASTVLVVVGVTAFIKRSQVPLRPEGPGVTISWLPPTVQRWQDPINEMSKKYKLDANFIAIVMALESGGYSKAKSEAGAEGLMQVTPVTAKDIASQYLKPPVSSYDLMDPRTSIEFGAAYLVYLRKEFGSYKQGPSWDATVELLAAGYNGGPGAAGKLYQGKGLEGTETVVYSRDAFNMWRERHSDKSPTYDRWLERGGSRLIDMAKTEDIKAN